MKNLVRVCLLLFSTATHAAILNFDDMGSVIGATGVEVAGIRYSVEFADGSCESLFGGCSADLFAFSTESGALAATQALFDQVLLVDPFSQIGLTIGPNAVVGCPQVFACALLTPFAVQGDLVDVVFGNLQGGRDTMGPTGSFSTPITSDETIAAYLRWTTLEATSPSMLPLLFVGLIAARWFPRRKVV